MFFFFLENRHRSNAYVLRGVIYQSVEMSIGKIDDSGEISTRDVS